MKVLSPFLFYLIASYSNAAQADDACRPLVPAEVVKVVEATFKEFRFPREQDNLPEDVAYSRKGGGTGCLGVTSADFDGDGVKDFALALTSKVGARSLVVVALSRASEWHFDVLARWSDYRSRLYVEALPPGTFERTEALTGPVAKDERLKYECPNSSVTVGETESAATDYCLISGKWLRVAISD